MKKYLLTRSETIDYHYIGINPKEPWLDYAQQTSFERGSFYIEKNNKEIKLFLSGIHSGNRRDRVNTPIRYSIAMDGVVDENEKTIIINLISKWLDNYKNKTKGKITESLDQVFKEADIENLFKDSIPEKILQSDFDSIKREKNKEIISQYFDLKDDYYELKKITQKYDIIELYSNIRAVGLTATDTANKILQEKIDNVLEKFKSDEKIEYKKPEHKQWIWNINSSGCIDELKNHISYLINEDNQSGKIVLLNLIDDKKYLEDIKKKEINNENLILIISSDNNMNEPEPIEKPKVEKKFDDNEKKKAEQLILSPAMIALIVAIPALFAIIIFVKTIMSILKS